MRAAFLLMLLALTVGCQRGADTEAGSSTGLPVTPDAPLHVKVVSPKKRTLSWVVEQPGTVQAFESAPIVAKLSGYVTKVHVDLGDKVSGPKFDKAGKLVEPGSLLAELAIPELEEELNQKLAEVAQRSAEITQAERGEDVAKEQIRSAEAQVLEAKALQSRVTADMERWNSELKRIEGLVSNRVIDAQTLDETRQQSRTAQSGKDEVLAKITSARAMVGEAKAKQGRAAADVLAMQAKKQVAEADVKRVQSLLSYTRIRAPFSGVITARLIHTGHFLQPMGTKPEPLFQLAKLETVRVVLDVPDTLAEKAVVGTPAVVKFPSMANREVKATISRASGALNPDSRTLRVEIDLPNPDGLWKPGTFASVRITATSAEAYTLPAAAVLFADETAYAFRVQNGSIEKQRVRVGRTDASNLEILGTRKAGQSTSDWTALTGTEQFALGKLGALADGQVVQSSNE